MTERGEYWSDEEKFEREQKELDRLCAESIEAAEKIEDGIDTSVSQLDRHLAASAAARHFSARHSTDNPFFKRLGRPSRREENGIEYLKLQRVLSGSYHKEKADYCHEMYLFHRGKAEEIERELGAGLTDPGEEEFMKGLSETSRKWAANWLRTEANCLEMPESKPAASPPKPDR